MGGATRDMGGRTVTRLNLYFDPIVAKALVTYCNDHGMPASAGATFLLAKALREIGYLPPER